MTDQLYQASYGANAGVHQRIMEVQASGQDVSFVGYLKTARITDDPRGDFLRDARKDPTLPEFIGSFAELLTWVMAKTESEAVLEAAAEVWLDHRNHLDRLYGVV